MYILGINPGHDATACLVHDGRVLAAVAEERLTRVKYHWGFPYRAIEECLRIGSVAPDEVDEVALCFEWLLESPRYHTDFMMSRQLEGRPDYVNTFPPSARWGMAAEGAKRLVISDDRHTRTRRQRAERAFMDALATLGIMRASLTAYEHHLCHAASAYYTSGFDDCLIVTADGYGDGLSATGAVGRAGDIDRICDTPHDSSPGTFYSAVTGHLGFKRLRHEGKITGLAAYGDPATHYDALKPCLDLSRDRRRFEGLPTRKGDHARFLASLPYRLLTDTFKSPDVEAMLRYFARNLGGATREDVSAAAQRVLEDAMVEHVRTLVMETGTTDVALAGGVHANVRVNQRIAEETGASRIFIHPNMGDGGAALGAAFLAWRRSPGGRSFRGKKLADVYWGPSYGDAEIATAAARVGLQIRQVADLEAAVADLLAEGKIVGWFNGGMEYGPRALGNRSILASPTDRSINDWLNKRLSRTEFMPFAPSVLNEAAADIFKSYGPSEHPASFMTITFDMYPEWQEKAPAISHVDGTARPQVVSRDQNPRYHRVINEFRKRTGLPLIVNTSFNAHEEPIVCTPEDAMRSFMNGSVDALAIGSFLLEGEHNQL